MYFEGNIVYTHLTTSQPLPHTHTLANLSMPLHNFIVYMVTPKRWACVVTKNISMVMLLNYMYSIHTRFSTCVNSISSDLCSFVLLVDMQLLLKDVAYMSKDGLQFEYLENESSATLWPDGVPPLLRVQNHPLLPLWIICNTYAAVLIVFAVVCIVFNIVNRKKKWVYEYQHSYMYLVNRS